MAKKKETATELNAVELYYHNYDPNLTDKSVKEMMDFRKNEDPAFDPLSKDWWSLGPMGCSYALISLCIKDDLHQTAEELAYRLAQEKKIPFTAAAYVVSKLRNEGRLFFYDNDYCIHIWEPKVVVGGRQKVC